MSGGFPHSDIHGSKPIPGSPWLNAGYHVLHRLLLPRHPPNALFALDLIQKEQGPNCAGSQNQSLSGCGPLGRSRVSKAVLTHITGWFARRCLLVSVLDLEQYRLSGSNPRQPHTRDRQAILMFLSLNDVNFRPVGRDNTSNDALSDQTANLPTNRPDGGSRWTRTIDLTLIRRVL